MRKLVLSLLSSFLLINPLFYTEAVSGTEPLTGAGSYRERTRTDAVKNTNILFLKGDYAALIKEGRKYLGRHKLSRIEKKEILYLVGLSCVKTGDFDNARDAFYEILEMAGNDYGEEAYIAIADSYFCEKEYDLAIVAYEEVLNMYPGTDRRSGIYNNMALIYKAEGNFNKADIYFQKVREDYGGSLEAERLAHVSAGSRPSYYIIQLGAYRSLKNAKKMTRKLKRKRYGCYIQKVRMDGKVLYRVRGGKFSNKNYARRLWRKLRRDRFPAKIIVE